jgi:hypothetical protein
MKLMTDASPKIEKSNMAGLGYNSAILYLAPEKTSGVGNVCPYASNGCKLTCLFTSGRGRYTNVQDARKRKTRLFYSDRQEFLALLHKDIATFIRRCDRLQLKPAIRLNGTSDIKWNLYLDMEEYPQVQFYDYTKDVAQMYNFLQGRLPKNYHITFSRSETNETEALSIRRAGGNVAVVFSSEPPAKWKLFTVFNGDKHDLRFLDKPGICGLKAKGRARRDTTGFVVKV